MESVMRKSREAVSVRVDVETYKYLTLFAETHRMPITDALARVVREREEQEPMSFVLALKRGPNGVDMYDVAMAGCPWSVVCFGKTESAALGALAEYRKENGYDPRRFKLQKEMEIVDLNETLGEPAT
jgi:hypothetical protein